MCGWHGNKLHELHIFTLEGERKQARLIPHTQITIIVVECHYHYINEHIL